MVKKWLFFLLLALLIVLIAVLLIWHDAVRMVLDNWFAERYDLPETDDWAGGKTYLGIQYSETSDAQYLDLYVPETDAPAPLFVLIHGGGFIGGDSQTRQTQLMYRYFRDHGYACASINYRLAQEAAFPAGLEDCKAAIRFLRANATHYGYDAEKITVFGESAGAYLAVMCAVTSDAEFNSLPFIGQTEAVSAEVQALVSYYAYLDKTNLASDLAELKMPRLVYNTANFWITRDAVGGYEDPNSFWQRKNVSEMTQEELDISDPHTYIARNLNAERTLSAWIVHGESDLTAPVQHSDRLNTALCQALGKDRVTYRRIPHMGHASDPLYSDAMLAEIDEFLKKAFS